MGACLVDDSGQLNKAGHRLDPLHRAVRVLQVMTLERADRAGERDDDEYVDALPDDERLEPGYLLGVLPFDRPCFLPK